MMKNVQNGDAGSQKNIKYRRSSRLAVVVALFLLIYIPSTFNWFSGRSVATDILRDGALYEVYQTEALVVRSEELISSLADGVFIPAANEGERVPDNSPVATVYDHMSYELMDGLKQINRTLLEEQYEALGRGSAVFSQEVESIEKDISGIIRKMIPDINRNSLYNASQRSKIIGGLMLKKAEAYSTLETDDPYINRLKQEKRAIEDELAQTSAKIYGSSPGHISFTLDGLEQELSPDGLSSLSPARFDEIISDAESNRAAPAGPIYGGLPVYAGEPFAKIVRDNTFYLVVKAPVSFTDRFAAGDQMRIQTETPYREFENAVVENCGDDGLMTIRLTKYLFDFINARVLNVSLVEKYKEGLKIPLKCLRNVDAVNGEAYVILLKGSHASVRKVKLLAANDVYAIIESIEGADADGRVNRYDTYIRDTANVEDGMQMSR